MWIVPAIGLLTCLAFALRHTRFAEPAMRASRWTYGIVMPLSLLYFPAKAGWRVHRVDCQWTFDWKLAVYSLGNVQHMVGFAMFFILTWAQIPRGRHPMAWSFAICAVLGFLVEIAEGATGIHHCRMRDLVPDMAGAAIGAVLILAAQAVAGLRQAARGDV